MPLGADLNILFPGRVLHPAGIHQIPGGVHLVYILAINDAAPAIVAGRRSPGNPGRARVIFDDLTHVTTHFKAMLVRAHYLVLPPGTIYTRYLVSCTGSDDAQQTEAIVHHHFNGNRSEIPPAFRANILHGLAPHSVPWTLLSCAMNSANDGLSDLWRWNNLGLISAADWNEISTRLQLHLVP